MAQQLNGSLGGGRFALATLKLGGLRGCDSVFDRSRRQWCDRHRIDYVEMEDWDPSLPGAGRQVVTFQKFQFLDLLAQGYDAVLYLDWDTLLMPTCPNLFTEIGAPIAITWDGFGHGDVNPDRQASVIPEPAPGVRIPPVPFRSHRVQGGFYFVRKEIANRFVLRNAYPQWEPYFADWTGGITDQEMITWILCALDLPFVVLGPEFNYLPFYHDLNRFRGEDASLRERLHRAGRETTSRLDAHIVHYCGFGVERRERLANQDWLALEQGAPPLMFADLEAFLA